MISRKAAICVMMLLLIVSVATAQEARNGTAAAPYLLIPQGARYLAGGGAAANVRGLESIYWNPAGLDRTETPINVLLSRRNFIADVDVNFVAAGIKFEKFGSLAISMRNINVGAIPVTTVFSPDGTGGSFEPTIFVMGATYSRTLNERTSVGLSLNYLNESFTRVEATGVSFDIGVQYSSFMDVNGWSIGIVARNLGSGMRYGGSGFWQQAQSTGADRKVTWYKVEAASFDLPSVVDVGTSYRMDMGESNAVILGATYENNQTATDEYKFMGEYIFGDYGALRGSYVMSDDAGQLENIFASYAFGGSFNLYSVSNFDMSIDYSFISTEYFDNTQVFALRFGF